jgi:hypothetical protein
LRAGGTNWLGVLARGADLFGDDYHRYVVANHEPLFYLGVVINAGKRKNGRGAGNSENRKAGSCENNDTAEN